MDINMIDEIYTRSDTIEMPTKILIVGDKKTGKTTLIKSFFNLCNVVPETNILLDSVRTWEGNLDINSQNGKVSFIEMDTNVEDLNQIGKLEEVLKTGRNYLCLVMKSNECSTLKSQNRMKLFFNKLNQISHLFCASCILFNPFSKKKEILKERTQLIARSFEVFVMEELSLQTMFKHLKFFEFEQTEEILNYFINYFNEIDEQGIKYFNNDKKENLDNEDNSINSMQIDEMKITNNYSIRRKKKRIFKITKLDRKKIINAVKEKFSEEENLSELINNNKQANSNNTNDYFNSPNEIMTTGKDLMSPLIDNDEMDYEENDNLSQTSNSKMNPNSLISISREVFYYLSEAIESKGSQVTEYILKHLKKTQTNLSFKNIQRRVYDAINVMNAVGILSKEKNILLFKGKMNLLKENISEEKRNKMNLKIKKENIKQKISNINLKQHELVALCSKYYLSQKLVQLNKNDNKRKNNSEKLGYPFVLIKQNDDAALSIKQDDYNSRICILSDKQFDVINEDMIMKMFLKDDIKNVKFGLKSKITHENYDYFLKHNLIEKYFNNFTQFNSNNSSIKEGFNTGSYSQSKNKNMRSPIFKMDNSYSFNDMRRASIDFLLNKSLNDEILSNISNSDINLDNNFTMNGHNFDFSDRHDFNTNQLSTNFFSKFLKNEEDKI